MLTGSAVAVNSELMVRLLQAREETDRVFETVQPSVLYDRPIRERHRIVFYVGHLEAFDWNLLGAHLAFKKFNPEFDHLFAFGIDPIDGSLPSDQPSDWPTLTQIEAYRRRIRSELDAKLSEVAESDELVGLLNIAIEHRLMHAETLEYMLHQLPYEAKVRPKLLPLTVAEASPVAGEMIEVPAGQVTLGLERHSEQFGWDNEFEAYAEKVPAFAIDRYKVTNGQFLQFLEDGGYSEPAYWTEEDWRWKTESKIWHPVFWVPGDHGFRYRSMYEERDLPLNSPVYVSHAEASAYASWTGKDLPTEPEWQRAVEGAQGPRDTRAEWDPGLVSGLASVYGVEGMIGTGWEWTDTCFAPFPGFRPHPAYPGYSANFFDSQHYVMKGGSPRTAACMLRKTFRNWFQAHYQYAYAGFRCVSR